MARKVSNSSEIEEEILENIKGDKDSVKSHDDSSIAEDIIVTGSKNSESQSKDKVEAKPF